nr:MAG TPA: hypothetical protein [Caudoviricetes sp.]
MRNLTDLYEFSSLNPEVILPNYVPLNIDTIPDSPTKSVSFPSASTYLK